MKGDKRVLVVMTSHDALGTTGKKTGAFAAEVAHPVDVFVRHGYTVDFASIRGGVVPLDGVETDDASVKAFLADATLQARLHTSRAVAEVVAAAPHYDAVFLAGGHGTMWDFADDAALQALVARTYEQGGVVGAVCHGPSGLVNVKLANGAYLVAGKRVAAFTNDEERAVGLSEVVPFLLADALTAKGALHQPAALWQAQVVVDGRLVTGQNPASAAGVAEAMVEVAGH